jgi:hypothetical protein
MEMEEKIQEIVDDACEEIAVRGLQVHTHPACIRGIIKRAILRALRENASKA